MMIAYFIIGLIVAFWCHIKDESGTPVEFSVMIALIWPATIIAILLMHDFDKDKKQ